MKIDVKFLPHEINNATCLAEQICIVLDIFRASSTITTALHNGCVSIRPLVEIEAARAAQDSDKTLLLAGERQSIKIEGFDFGNSPLEFTKEKVAGRKLVMNTSNGTKAILACSSAHQVLIGAFINAATVVQMAHSSGRDITIVCAGTVGEFSLEDSLCAGYMAKLLTELGTCQLSDTAYAAMLMYEHASTELENHAGRSTNGARLYEIGLAEDVSYCLTLNSTDTLGCYLPNAGIICKIQ